MHASRAPRRAPAPRAGLRSARPPRDRRRKSPAGQMPSTCSGLSGSMRFPRRSEAAGRRRREIARERRIRERTNRPRSTSSPRAASAISVSRDPSGPRQTHPESEQDRREPDHAAEAHGPYQRRARRASGKTSAQSGQEPARSGRRRAPRPRQRRSRAARLSRAPSARPRGHTRTAVQSRRGDRHDGAQPAARDRRGEHDIERQGEQRREEREVRSEDPGQILSRQLVRRWPAAEGRRPDSRRPMYARTSASWVDGAIPAVARPCSSVWSAIARGWRCHRGGCSRRSKAHREDDRRRVSRERRESAAPAAALGRRDRGPGRGPAPAAQITIPATAPATAIGVASGAALDATRAGPAQRPRVHRSPRRAAAHLEARARRALRPAGPIRSPAPPGRPETRATLRRWPWNVSELHDLSAEHHVPCSSGLGVVRLDLEGCGREGEVRALVGLAPGDDERSR